jgi:hypothetical protein
MGFINVNYAFGFDHQGYEAEIVAQIEADSLIKC